ncbi:MULTISPECIES: ABC transporter ATP-binding protein [Bifidobacterium]|uniref:ABC transporter ATP-binding protein n=1 Tax=Bifidobacterium TaxID=1678 RepID=UPI001BDD62B5|nr:MULTISPECIES: ABC transporter ATP-binding protein [Bifidobacterium]MBT1162713.1 ABC transporter ATP-binding protein [Bifidobacterium sp. SO1]MBW3079375.1 ABC transporter ATP-binding protein [Bifidobacterium simiiventris]
MSVLQHAAQTTDPSAAAVLTRGLVKRYGDFRAVDGLDLNVPAHGVYGLLGPNGAGKSTTMKLLLGLTSATSGDMWMLGEKMDGRHRLQPGRVGSMIEGPSFYPGLSGLDNCRMVADYLDLPRGSASAIVKQVGLAGHEHKRARDYSLGMKQRLGIAMALISRPELLLLDEPTNGLDAQAVVEVREMIMALSREQGITVIISSHILSEIEKMAPIVGVIASGRLRYQGSLDALREEGHIDLRVSDAKLAATMLDENRIDCQWLPDKNGGVLRLPELSDRRIGVLVAQLVEQGIAVYRVSSERKTLEQAFLELIENQQHHESTPQSARSGTVAGPVPRPARAASLRSLPTVGRAVSASMNGDER